MFNEDVLNSDRHLDFNEFPKVAARGESTILQQVVRLFTRYHNALSIACWTPMREELKEIRAEAHRNSLTGTSSFEALVELAAYLDIESLPKKDFAYFYRFSFFLLRQYEYKSIANSVGIRVWQMFCKKRFKFFLPLCRFVENYSKKFMTEDTWIQLLEFNQTIHSDFSNFDPQGAWPTLIDEFVEHLDKAQQLTDMKMPPNLSMDEDRTAMSPSVSISPVSLQCTSSYGGGGGGGDGDGGGGMQKDQHLLQTASQAQRAKRSLAEIDSVVNSLNSVKPFDADSETNVGTPEKKKLKTIP